MLRSELRPRGGHNCSDLEYQDEYGTTECKLCTPHAFSVPDRATPQHCRCEAGFFHAHADRDKATWLLRIS